ncbi:uncharacterized protein LOC119595524 [Penaeus monodon]|uniref:uncharacterized protein LOC119595524 n=1 Tax=Penaeus monodon TaxID=6687 RepID=UPI0018A791C8|nr:uncharacterized protein LOC119595524 [Penaeus monodon]
MGNENAEGCMGNMFMEQEIKTSPHTVEMAQAFRLAIMNTCCTKKDQQLITYSSGNQQNPDRLYSTTVATQILRESPEDKKEGKKTWWWNSEVQEAVKLKRECKVARDRDGQDEELQKILKEAIKQMKKVVAIAKKSVYIDLYNSLVKCAEGINEAIKIAKSRNNNSQDVYQANTIKDADGRVLNTDEKISDKWRKYFNELMIIENKREKVRRNTMPNTDNEEIALICSKEVGQALKKMKNGKAVGPDNMPVEVYKSIGNTGLELLTGWVNNIIGTDPMPDEWRDSILIPICKNKVDIQDCGNYRGIKLMLHNGDLGKGHRQKT